MLSYNLSLIGSVPIYEYLYTCIKNDIISGILPPDYKLPSKRSFSKNLGISTITVESAYGQLLAEGYIYSIEKKGYYVGKILPKPSKNEESNYHDNIPAYFFDFSNNEGDTKTFPFSVWSHVTKEVLNNYQKELLTPSPSKGIYLLRSAISKHLKEYKNIEVSPEQIIIGAGAEYLYGVLILLLGNDKKYAFENPGYRKLSSIYNLYGASYCPIDFSTSGLNLNMLRSEKCDIVHISPSHHFPTGIVMPINNRYELLAWANETKDRYIIEDDYDSEFRLKSHAIPSLLNIDLMEKVIYMNTFSKTLTSTIRISYMILPKHLLEKFNTKLGFYNCAVSNFEQYNVADFINKGYFEKHINRMRTYYDNKRAEVVEIIRKHKLYKFCSIEEEKSGLHFILKLKGDFHDNALEQKLLKKGIRLNSISSYYSKKSTKFKGCFLVNYSSLKVHKLESALDVIYEVLREG